MKYTKYILSIAIPFGLLYLVGCFNQTSFNASLWSEGVRDAISIVSCIISFFCIIVLISIDLSKWKKTTSK